MVRFTLKRSLREESCCSLLVVKGGAALRRRSFLSTERTTQSAFSSAARIFSASSPLVTSIFSSPLPTKRASKAGGLRRRQMCVDGPVFVFLERLDFAFAFDDQTQRNGLHAAGRKTAADFIPEQRGNLISHEPVEHTAGLLRVDEILIDGAGMLKRRLHGALGNFVEGNALNARRRCLLALLELLRFFRFAVIAEFERQMGGDGFALAVRVRRQKDEIGRGRQLLQLGHNLLFAGDDDVIRLEVVRGVDAQRALGQILDVAERGLDGVALTQIFLDGFRLGGRFDDD